MDIDTVVGLLGAGVEYHQIFQAIRTGSNPSRIAALLHSGLANHDLIEVLVAGATLQEYRAYVSAGVSPTDVGEFRRAGVTPEWAAEWKRAGHLDVAASWGRVGFPDPDDAHAWVESCYSPADAKSWGAAGLRTVDVAVEWMHHGFGASLARAFAELGLSPDDAAPRWEMAYNPDEVAAVPAGQRPTPKAPSGRWSDAFSRSRIHPTVFTVKEDFEREVLVVAAHRNIPRVSSTRRMYSSSTDAWALLDGLVTRLHADGFEGMRSGIRVVGFAPFRLLCHYLGVAAPRLLSGESRVPDLEELLAAARAEQRRPREELLAQARLGLDISDRDGMIYAVYRLYGEQAVPYARSLFRKRIPGDGPWGDYGLTLYDQEVYTEAAIPVEEAKEWLALGFEVSHAIHAAPYGLETVRAMLGLHAEMRPWQVVDLLGYGVGLNDASAVIAGGDTPDTLIQRIRVQN